MIFGLTQVEKILDAIGNPHRGIQAIHIDATNGKGSTAAMVASILEKEGYRVGLDTSPHLIRDKDFRIILHPLAPIADHLNLSRPNTPRADSPFLLKKCLDQNRKRVEIIDDLREAIGRGISMVEEEDLVCITGSLYTLGEARAYFISKGKYKTHLSHSKREVHISDMDKKT